MSKEASTATADEPYILALDEGTTNAKAFAIAADGTVLASGSAPVSVRYLDGGGVEQDAAAIWSALTGAIRDCLAQAPGQPAGIAISNQRESVLCWDRSTGEALTPILGWQDSRTAEFCDWLRSPEREFAVAATTGLSLDPMFSAPKMRYLLDRLSAAGEPAPERLGIGTIDSWLISRLTGGQVYAIEAGNASRTLLLDLATRDWSPAMCELFGIPVGLLPRVLASDGGFGTTQGLGFIADSVPILAVLGDSHAALFGHGCRSPQEGKATFGTGSSVMVPCGSEMSIRPGISTTLAWVTHEGPMYGHEGNIVASGTAMDWMARTLGVAPGKELDDLARTVEDAGGVALVPAFTGLGAPWWDRRAVGTISGVTAGTERGHLARAALEAVAHQIADVLEAMDVTSLRTLHADGGAAASRLLMGLQADLLGREVIVSPNAEVSALGAALLAMQCLGWELPAQPEPAARYTPQLTDSQRATRRAGWKAAMARSRLRPEES